MEYPPTMGVTTTLEQQNHSSGIFPTMGVTTLEQQNYSSIISPYNGSSNNLTTESLVEYAPIMEVTTTLEQQNHSSPIPPYNGRNNNLGTK